MDDSTVAVDHPRLGRLLVRRLVADFPEDLNVRLAEDPAFLTALGVSGNRVFKIGPHEVQADPFWNAAAEVVRSKTQRTIPAAGHELILKLDDEAVPTQLIVEDTPARRQTLPDQRNRNTRGFCIDQRPHIARPGAIIRSASPVGRRGGYPRVDRFSW